MNIGSHKVDSLLAFVVTGAVWRPLGRTVGVAIRPARRIGVPALGWVPRCLMLRSVSCTPGALAISNKKKKKIKKKSLNKKTKR